MIPCATTSTTSTAGAGRTTRRGRERSSQATAPTSRRRSCGPAWKHEADPPELIRDYLTQRVEHGAVQSRADVIAALEADGLEVPRQGKSYVTVRNPDDGKRWRLKGALYEHDFEPERLDLQAPAPA